jgi:hypothetical protein
VRRWVFEIIAVLVGAAAWFGLLHAPWYVLIGVLVIGLAGVARELRLRRYSPHHADKRP